jgi:hypothetical protein
MSKKQVKKVTPKLRKFWQRAVFLIILSVAGSLLICWLLAQVDLHTLSEPGSGTGRRRAMIRLMLSLMPAETWCWVLASLSLVISFLGDWYYYRFKDLPDEIPDSNNSDLHEE